MRTYYSIAATTYDLFRVDGDIRDELVGCGEEVDIDHCEEFDNVTDAVAAIRRYMACDWAYQEAFDRYGNLICVTHTSFEVLEHNEYEEGDAGHIDGGDNCEYCPDDVAPVFDTLDLYYDPSRTGHIF